MKTATYRTDPETGVRYKFGGVFGLSRSLDEEREHAVDIEKMLERRLPEIRSRLQARAVPVPVPVRSRPSVRFQNHTPAPAVYPAPSGTAHQGYRSRGSMIARESFTAIDPSTHETVIVRAGRTILAAGHWLTKLRPNAFEYAV